ncbi:MAG: aldehyde dehydrogenase [Alphaproteobacteria bacterium]|nr:aldehyde dehydrogenase [Alphaproteobacteria bacterium]
MNKLQRYHMYIAGEWCDSSDKQFFPSINPSTGEEWAEFPEATKQDIDRAVTAAHDAFMQGEWAEMLPSTRGKYLRRLADLLAEHSEHLGKIEAIDTGKLFSETRFQAKYIAEFFHFYAGCADKICGTTLPIDKKDVFALTTREPLGVVAAIVPWNSQLFLTAVKMAPALAAGNCIVLKTSELAAAAMLEFGKLVEQAGFPKGVVNIVTGHGEVCGKELTSHPLVQRISFTGGANAARHVIQNSTHNFAQTSLELGGKSPFIVFDDANIASAVNGCIAGIFGASGQSCVAGSRLYLQENIADEFLQKLLAQVKEIHIGDALDEKSQMGPLCSHGQIEHIEREIKIALEQGGTLLHGGKRAQNLPDKNKDGLFFEPTIIECHSQNQQIVDTELFGPVLAILRFKDETEAIKLANDTKYGLAAGLFTQNSARSLRVSKALRAGIVWVNLYRMISPIVEFGGFKDSGYGRESGMQAMMDYTRPKAIWLNMSDEPMANPFMMR